MKRRIQKFVTTNPGYKLLAVLLSFALWLVVYNSDDPNKTVTFTVPITVENENVLSDMGKCYEVINNAGTVTFAVTAKRSVLDKLENSDFTAIADFSQLTFSEDSQSATVEIEIGADRYASSVKISGRTRYLEISLENVASKLFVVKAATTGALKSGYTLGSVMVGNPNVLKVEGPESVVNRIAEAIATVDVSIMEQARSYSISAKPVLYDSDGNVVSSNRLTLSDEQMTVVTTILDTKEVDIKYSTSGSPAEDTVVAGIESSASRVKIKGTAVNLNKVALITIPAEAVSVEGADEDFSVEVRLSDYLPEGVEVLNEDDNKVTITVHIVSYSKRNITIPLTQIEMVGLAGGYTASFDTSTPIAITVIGTTEDMADFDSSQVDAFVDLTGLKAGEHTVNVDLGLDNEKYSYNTVSLPVIISVDSSVAGDE